MAATAVSVASSLPWKQIIKHLPEVVEAARELMKRWRSKPQTAPIDPSVALDAQVKSLTQRVASFEDNERAQSEVVSQLAEQLQAVVAGLKETTARQTHLKKLCVASAVASGIAIAISIGVALTVANL
jgi:hypothetical protein